MPSFRLRERRCPLLWEDAHQIKCLFLLSELARWHGVLYKGRAESASVLIRLTGALVLVNVGEQGYGVIFLYFP